MNSSGLFQKSGVLKKGVGYVQSASRVCKDPLRIEPPHAYNHISALFSTKNSHTFAAHIFVKACSREMVIDISCKHHFIKLILFELLCAQVTCVNETLKRVGLLYSCILFTMFNTVP